MGSAYFMPLLDGCWGVEYEPDQAEEAADTAAADTASPILAPHELQKRCAALGADGAGLYCGLTGLLSGLSGLSGLNRLLGFAVQKVRGYIVF